MAEKILNITEGKIKKRGGTVSIVIRLFISVSSNLCKSVEEVRLTSGFELKWV